MATYSNTIVLKGCPVCGAIPSVIHINYPLFWIECERCHFRVEERGKQACITQWNNLDESSAEEYVKSNKTV